MIANETENRRCRFCKTELEHTFADLGVSPLANSYLEAAELTQVEPFYPLRVFVCSACLLVQLEELGSPVDIFSDYPYFSSFSESWLEHAKKYALEAIERFNLGSDSRVVEIGSNDGYLLRFFKEAGIPVLGIEPAANVARAAREKDIETKVRFFNSALAGELAKAGRQADLIVGNNVLAHIPRVNNLMIGLKKLLKPGGIISMEFPHLLSLIEQNQFDTIYHEHYSYFSLTTAAEIFGAHGLPLFDAEELSTHGGSLRIYACNEEAEGFSRSERLAELLDKEEKKGLTDLDTYLAFGEKVQEAKREILKFLIDLKEKGAAVAGYGAPAKSNTLLNYLGVGPDFIEFTVDRSPHKQGRFLPGSRIPVYSPEEVFVVKPDYLIIFPWNLQEEITGQMAGIRDWGGKFVVLIPEVKVF